MLVSLYLLAQALEHITAVEAVSILTRLEFVEHPMRLFEEDHSANPHEDANYVLLLGYSSPFRFIAGSQSLLVDSRSKAEQILRILRTQCGFRFIIHD